MNLDSILKKEPLQCYIDVCLYNTIPSSNKNVAVSKKEGTSTVKASNLNLILRRMIYYALQLRHHGQEKYIVI